jgi:hypothetical protein
MGVEHPLKTKRSSHGHLEQDRTSSFLEDPHIHLKLVGGKAKHKASEKIALLSKRKDCFVVVNQKWHDKIPAPA